jgi:hypothetical protein
VRPRTLWLAAVAAAVLAGSGCTTVVSGTGRPAGGATEPGRPTSTPSPTAEPSPRVKLLRGKVREAHRLAGVVQRPDVTFPEFDRSCAPTGTYYSLDSLTAFGGVFPDSAVPALRRGGYLTGYAQCRALGTSRSLIAAAFEMRDRVACARAAHDLALALRGKGAVLVGVRGLPGAYSVEQVNQKDPSDPAKRTNLVQRIVPRGAVLNYVWSRSQDLRTGRDAAGRVLRGQLDRMRDFRVTPAGQLPDLDDDPQGLRPRRAELAGAVTAENGGYDLPGYLAMAEDVAFERELLTRDGLAEYFFAGATNEEAGRYVYRGVGLYQLRDEVAARDVVTQFTALDKRITQQIKILTVAGVPPGSFCFAKGDQFGQIDQRCFFHKGSVAVQVDVTGATRTFTEVAGLAKLVQAQFGKL